MEIKISPNSLRGLSEDDVRLVKTVILSDHPLMNYIKHSSFTNKKKMDKFCEEPIPYFPSYWFHNKMSNNELMENGVKQLLSEKEEKILFLKYNYIRYRISVLRRKATKEGKNCLLKMLNLYKTLAKIEKTLVAANLSLVICVVGSFRSRIASKATWDILVSEGTEALLRAIRHFDVNTNRKFSTLAWTSVRNALITFTNNERNLKYQECHISDEIWILKEDKKEEIFSEKLLTLVRMVIDKNLANLNKEEIQIIRMRYPDSCENIMSLEEIGDKLKVSRTTIKNRMNIIFNKIKSFLVDNSNKLGISDEIPC